MSFSRSNKPAFSCTAAVFWIRSRGPVEYEDFNDDKAYGGRVDAKTDAVGSLTVGASFYRGGYYDRSPMYRSIIRRTPRIE